MVGLGTNGVQHAAPDMKLSCDDDLLCKVVDHDDHDDVAVRVVQFVKFIAGLVTFPEIALASLVDVWENVMIPFVFFLEDFVLAHKSIIIAAVEKSLQ